MNHLRTLILALCVLASTSTLHAQAVPWTVDKNHSTIGFSARHLGLAKVRGEFTNYDATIEADKQSGKITAVEATAQAASVDTGNEKRDAHLRSEDFFAATEHPVLKLKTKSIRFKGNDFTAVVDLTLRGTTHQVTFKGSLLGVRKVDFGDGMRNRAAYEASATIDRKKFGLKFGAVAEGVSVVSDEVVITLELEISTKA